MNKTHPLKWPINIDGDQSIENVTIAPLTVGQERELSKIHKDDEKKMLRACIVKSTGLTEQQMLQLVAPDYTTISREVLALMTKPASEFSSQDIEHDSPVLLHPIVGDTGEQITSYTIKPPTVQCTDMMDAHKDEWERTMFISASCSGLSATELSRLSLPDWTQMQNRLLDFLTEPADFFQ
ncbi:phage tail assembly protein [Pseudoalteromonas rubra]|uniref:phage tail assembly protein n=1 Tax=Pseudoalteromonas rubra TaxID=43658 RepID=UPI000F7A3FF0|nr:phage tail assembly protein [Pseudoalteromonas rubra]